MALAWYEPYENMFIDLTSTANYPVVELEDGKEVTPS